LSVTVLTLSFGVVVATACEDHELPPDQSLVAPFPTVHTPPPSGTGGGALDASPAAVPPDASVVEDAGAPGTIATSKSAADQVDLVGPGDQNVTPDGRTDGTIAMRVVGPIDGLILVTTNAEGTPAGGQQWDTIVQDDPLPDIGSPFSVGAQTWLLATYEGATMLNGSDGRIVVPEGIHDLTLAASPSGFFTAGQHFRLHARRLGSQEWYAGPVFTW
jgi:hypothetical protein